MRRAARRARDEWPSLLSLRRKGYRTRLTGLVTHYGRREGVPFASASNFQPCKSAADEALEQLQRLVRLLLLRHVSATLDQPQGGVGQSAPELDADLERHDAIVVAPQNQRRQRDGLEAIGERIDV